VARIIAPWLSERLGQQVIIENKPGAGTNLAAQAVVNAPPDGYTLLFVTPVNAINATLYGGLSFDFLRDIDPIAGIVSVPFILVVNPAVPAQTVADLIHHAKANPGKVSMCSAGVGSVPHMAGELFKLMAGVDMLHVPYRGSAPALTDLMAGHVQVMFDAMPASLPLVRSGALRALAVTTFARLVTMPDLATVAETVPGYETSSWYGIGAPKGTPSEIIERIDREIAAGLENASVKRRIAEANAAPMPLTAVQFGKHIAAETEKWGKVVRSVGIKAD
jgi:tripartite-type tricarboxylate transporter receptor subunit TctC